jgi:hypothetical protein
MPCLNHPPSDDPGVEAQLLIFAPSLLADRCGGGRLMRLGTGPRSGWDAYPGRERVQPRQGAALVGAQQVVRHAADGWPVADLGGCGAFGGQQ